MRGVPKPWGREEIFAENERYAGKILHIEPGHSLSLQYHERKDETIYVLEGEVFCWWTWTEPSAEEMKLVPGRILPDPPGNAASHARREPCVLVEVSSPELDDVVRLEDAYGRAGTTAP